MGDIDKTSVERAYALWAPVYDLVFGAVFDAGRRASIAAAEQACGPGGGRILEVGVGTGISLPDYARTNRLVGVDLSEPMLRKAQERVAEQGLSNVEALAVMDAERHGAAGPILRRGGGAISSSPRCPIRKRRSTNSRASSSRAARSCWSITSAPRAGPRRVFELCFAPLARRLGWRPEFRFRRLADWAERHGGVRVIERRPMPPLGHFSLIRFERLADGERRASA